MRKLLYWIMKPYFEALRADVDYCLMLEGENNFPKEKKSRR